MLSSTHDLTMGGEPVEGWERVCCLHADILMMESAKQASDLAANFGNAEAMAAEAAEALGQWRASHEAECGPAPMRWKQDRSGRRR